MKKIISFFVILAIVLVFGFTVVGCDNENGDTVPQTVTYTGTANGMAYTLKITQNINSRSVYAPAAGDSYELTVGSKKSAGTVVSFTGGILTLKPSNAETVSFTAVVSGSNISDLNGTITWNDNTTEAGPGSINGGNNNEDGGIFVLTDIPEEYNGKYAFFQAGVSQNAAIYGCQSVDSLQEGITTLVQISNGKVNLPMWYIIVGTSNDSVSKYTGNDTLTSDYIEVLISNSSTTASPFRTLGGLVFQSITFSNGSATKSWNDGTVYEIGDD